MKRYLLLLGMSYLGSAIAAEPAKVKNTDKAITLDTMEISATSLGRGSDVEDMDISTTVITREDIQKSPQLTLDQMLNQQMGIWTSQVPSNQVDPTGAVVQMRGFGGGEKVLVMVDGVPMNDGYFRTIDWSQIPKDTIDKVEIIRGGGGAALWGNLAEGGVINIVTREPAKDEKRIGFAYGSFNTKVGDAAATLYHSDKVKIGANINVIESDGYNTTPKAIAALSPNLTSGDTRTHNALLSTYFNPTDTSKFFVKLSGHELLQDHTNYASAHNEWYKYDMRSGGQINYSDTGSINLASFFNYSMMDKANGALIPINRGNTTLTPNLQTGQNVAGSGVISGQLESMNYQSYGISGYIEDQLKLGDWGSLDNIKLGVDARGVTTEDSNNLYQQKAATGSGANTIRYNSATQFATLDMAGQNVFEGVFAQATYRPKGIPLDVTLGVREDLWQSVLGNSSVHSVATGKTTPVPTPDQYFNQIDPRLGLKYSFNNGIDLRAAAYRNFAAPGMNQLFRSFASASSATLGNTALTPESNFGQEAGIDFTSNQVKIKFTAYHNEISNFINSVGICGGTAPTCTDVDRVGLASGTTKINKNYNVGDATTEGLEAFAEWKALDTLTLNASIVNTHAYASSFNSFFTGLNNKAIAGGAPLIIIGKQLKDVPSVMITTGGSWNIMPTLQFGWIIKTWPKYFTGTVVTSSQNINEAATTADAHLSYKATKNIELYVNAQNISNSTYIASNNDGSSSSPAVMGMPRSILGGFKLDF